MINQNGNDDINSLMGPVPIKSIRLVTSDEFIELLTGVTKIERPKQEMLERYKAIIDKTPDKFLQYQFDWSIKSEHYELSEYIKQTAEQRNFKLIF